MEKAQDAFTQDLDVSSEDAANVTGGVARQKAPSLTKKPRRKLPRISKPRPSTADVNVGGAVDKVKETLNPERPAAR